VIPVSGANPNRQIQIMQDYRSTALVTTPSHALTLADALVDSGVNRSALALRWGLFGAEPWSESMRAELEEKLKLTATDNYGLSEVMGPGVSGECLERAGLHVAEDHFLVEVVDPETLEPLPEGQVGELVVTTLTREALPVVRFRTRDLTSVVNERCACGRTLARMGRVKGRTDDLVIVKGARVFPSEIEAVLFEIEGTAPHYQIVLERRSGQDEATVLVEAGDALAGRGEARAELQGAVQRRLASELGVSVEVRIVDPRSIQRSAGKARRVVDQRRP
jgi:phenylacetate-CoA ligase